MIRLQAEEAAVTAFARLLAAGDHAGANGVMEERWRRTRSDFHKALCKVALAFLQLERGRAAGAEKFFGQALEMLCAFPSREEGVDVPGLVAGLESALAALRRGDAGLPAGARAAIVRALEGGRGAAAAAGRAEPAAEEGARSRG